MSFLIRDDVIEPFFPYNVIAELEIVLQELFPHTNEDARNGVRIYRRPLNNGDSDGSIGLYPVVWNPDEDSTEMRGRVPMLPTMQRYPIVIDSLVTDPDEWSGIRAHSYFAQLIRHELFNSEHLEAVLPGMSTTLRGSVEMCSRYGVESQTYMHTSTDSMFTFMARTTFFVDTQIK